MTLQEHSIQISQRFEEFRNDKYTQKARIMEEAEANLEALRQAANEGDTSENQAYTTALEKVSDYDTQLRNVMKQISDIEIMQSNDNYKSIGLVVLGTTIKLQINNGDSLIVKLYRGDISDIDKGMLAQNSKVGRALWKKKIGDVVKVIHRVTGESIEYRILDLW